MITACPKWPCMAYHPGHGSYTYPPESRMREEYYYPPSSPLSPRLSSRRNSGRREHIFHHQPPGSPRTSLRRSRNGDLVLERRTSHSATVRSETDYNHARQSSSPSLYSRMASTVSNTRSGHRLSHVMLDEESEDDSFEGSDEHYYVDLPMSPRAPPRPTPPTRTGAEPTRSPAAPVRPVPSRRAPAEPTPTHTQEPSGILKSKADEQHVVHKNLRDIRQNLNAT